jgi:predicted nucleic acid-binding protein
MYRQLPAVLLKGGGPGPGRGDEEIGKELDAARICRRSAEVLGTEADQQAPVDLLIAATSERERVIVLYDDHDDQTVATVT